MNFCLWITGLPGSGKSTITTELERLFSENGIPSVTLNLDRLRKTLTPRPIYTDEERNLVYRALVVMAQLLTEHGEKNVIIDATGNRRRFRDLARDLIPLFIEVYVKCPLEICKAREASRKDRPVEKNLYAKAEQGKLEGGLPGVSSPYEAPQNPEVEVPSDQLTPRESANVIIEYLISVRLSPLLFPSPSASAT